MPLTVLAVGVVAIGGYYVLDGLAQDVLYDAVRLGSALTILFGVWRRRSTAAASWYLIGLGQLLFGLGDVTWDVYKYVQHTDPFPSLADVLYLAAYPALAVGVLLQVRRAFRGRDRLAVIDAVIVATGIGLVIWALVLRPTVQDPDLTGAERLISFAYPVMDILLVAMGTRLAFARRSRTVASTLWDLGLVSLLVADTAFLATQLAGTYADGSFIDAAFLLSGVLWAAAALHHQASDAMRVVRDDRAPDGVTGGRLAVLIGTSLLGPLLIGVQGTRGERVDLAVILSAALALMSLAMLRITGTRFEPRIRNLALSAAAVGALVTLSLNTVSELGLSYSNPELLTAVETALALIAFLVTHLVYLRFRRTRLLSDLLLAYGMGLLGAANLFFVVAMAAGHQPGGTVFQTWAPLVTRVLAASAIVWGAWARPRRVSDRAIVPRLLAAHLGSAGVVAVGVLAFQDRLPVAVTVGNGRTGDSSVEGHAVLLAAQIVLMALFWLAAGGFVQRSQEDPGPLMGALVAGFILAGFSRLSFSLHPPLSTDVVDTGDLLRLGSYVVFLVGAGREIHNYWHGLASAAVSKERERTARELHDGLMQELSFIRSQTADLVSGRASPAMAEQVVLATERALEESRRAVRVLSGGDEELSSALRRAADEIAIRSGVDVRMDTHTSCTLSADVVVPLSRIVREASSNAVRHGEAKGIVLCVERLSCGSLRVAVSDDGKGFNPHDVAGGFGLRSMRERAAALGGDLKLTSTPGGGTTVEVILAPPRGTQV